MQLSDKCAKEISAVMSREEKEFRLVPSCEDAGVNLARFLRRATWTQEELESVPSEDAGDGGECKMEGLAFLIMIDERQTPQSVQRLVDRLVLPRNFIIIHVDGKSSASFHSELLRLENDNVHILPRSASRPVAWGGPSMLRVELEGMRYLVEHGGWDHVLVLSGTDYPVKTVENMASAMSSIGAKSCLEIFPQEEHAVMARGLDRMFVECENYVHVVGNKTRALPLKMWGGSAWASLHREFVEFVVACLFQQTSRDAESFFQTAQPLGINLDNDCKIVVHLLEWVENSLSSEEIFFHTVLMNTRFCNSLHPDYMRWVKWQAESQGVHCDKADWCGKSPHVLQMRDVRSALSSTSLFARKFDKKTHLLQDFVDDALAGKNAFSRRLRVLSATAGSEGNSSVLVMFDGCEFSSFELQSAQQPVIVEIMLVEASYVCSLTITSDRKLTGVEFSLFSQNIQSGDLIRAYGNKKKNDSTARSVQSSFDPSGTPSCFSSLCFRPFISLFRPELRGIGKSQQ
mmetsp:Transcript_3849/g.13877  ORF Transcript_3849/g.13877 Transcript_3849/m.13877 type:complete len:516 (-) Transcript_3849:1331-2878(-)